MRVALSLPGLAAAAVIALCPAAHGAHAAGSPADKRAPPLPRAGIIKTGGVTTTPYGWLDFCNRYESECRGGLSPAADIALTAGSWHLIRAVNAKVNADIEPLSDMQHWGTMDQWDLPGDGYGDCEDYVLLKRKLLIAAGLPRQALLVTIVKDEQGEGHAVLTAKTDHGEFVLDNMRDKIRPWNEVPYRFVKRQSQEDPNVWIQIGEPTSAPATVSR